MMWTKILLVTLSCVFLQDAAATYRNRFAYRRQRTLTCAERVRAEKLRDAEHPIADKEYPQCDYSGNYEVKQCYGRWTRTGHCSCVDPQSGQTLADIKGATYRSVEGSAMTCQCAKDYPDAADRAKYCDLNTGDYAAVVCIESKCRCAARWGAPLMNYGVFDKGQSNCLCARRQTDIPRGMVGVSYDCNTSGAFNSVQCLGSRCYCADDEGQRVGDSVHIASASTLNC